MGEHARAIDDFGEAIKLSPGNVRAYLNRGAAYLGKRERDRAIGDIDQSVKMDPHCPIGFDLRGFAYELKDERDRAMADYDRAIELDPDPGNASVFIRRARAYQGKRDYDHAINDLGQALKLESQNAYALNNRCFYRAIAGAFDGALPIATKHCGYDLTAPSFSIAAASPISRRVRSTLPLPIMTRHLASTRKRQTRCIGAAWPNG
jgi:tetratricopeptide (TPR) repeat protein